MQQMVSIKDSTIDRVGGLMKLVHREVFVRFWSGSLAPNMASKDSPSPPPFLTGREVYSSVPDDVVLKF
jgi:hypothetical protein